MVRNGFTEKMVFRHMMLITTTTMDKVVRLITSGHAMAMGCLYEGPPSLHLSEKKLSQKKNCQMIRGARNE